MNIENKAKYNKWYLSYDIKAMVISLIISICIFIVLVSCMPIQFETNDDPGIRAHWAGWRTGYPQASELGFSTIGLGYIISGLYRLLPNIPWFTFMHLGIMGFSFWAVLYALCEVSYKERKAWLAYIALFPLLALCIFSVLMLQFTVTPAFALGAAIVTILHYREDVSKKDFTISLVILIILFMCSFSLRPNSFFIGLPLYLCVVGMRMLNLKKIRKQLIALTLIPLVLMGILYGINELFYSNKEEYARFREYNYVRSRFTDFPKPTFEEAPEVFMRVGLDEMETQLILNWYFTFEKVNKELFTQLNESVALYYSENPENQASSSRDIRDYLAMIRQQPSHAISFGLMILFLILIMLFPTDLLALGKNKRKIIVLLSKYSDKLVASGIILFFLLANIYFTELGRFPNRVYRALVLIAAPPLLYMSWEGFVKFRIEEIGIFARKKCYIVSSGSLICIVILSFLMFNTIDVNGLEERRLAGAWHGGLVHEYAVNNPQYVFFTELITMRTSPFLVFPDGKPTNLIPAIGAGIHSPTYIRQIEINGFTHMSEYMLLDCRARLLTRNMQPALVEFYRERFPEYEFVQVGNIGEEVYIYRLLPIEKLYR